MAKRSDGEKKLNALKSDKRIEAKYDHFRKKYPEIRGNAYSNEGDQ